MVVGNLRGTVVGDFQGGTVDKLQFFFAPDCMVKSGDFRQSKNLQIADYTQSTSLRHLLTETFKKKNFLIEVRFPEIEPVYDENGVLVNAFTIDTFAFQGAEYTSLSFPKTLYKVNKNAFQNCKKLTTIGEVPNLAIIGNDAFYRCNALTGLDFKNTKITSIGDRAFYEAGLQTKIEFPSTLTSIGEQAFYNIKGAKAIVLSPNVTTFGKEPFKQATTIEYFDFNGSTLETIGDYFFWKNSSLKAISLPEGLKYFGTRPFESCTALEVMYLPDSLTTLTYFQKSTKLYFVNEPFSIDWSADVFSSDDWNGQKPEKPEVYYMPKSLIGFSEADLHTCTSINKTVVFPTGIASVPEQYTFFAIADVNFVFLGNVTSININSTQISNYYFIDNSVTRETLTVEGNGSHRLFFHSDGNVHICERTDTQEATCENNAKITTFCFCETMIDENKEIENTALGHEHDLTKGAAITDILFANGYTADGCKEIKCSRCDEKDYSSVVEALFNDVKYSVSETGFGICITYSVNREALAVCKDAGKSVSFGVVAIMADKVENNGPLANDGTVAAQNNVVAADVTADNINAVTLKIAGDENTWRAHSSKAIYVLGYATNGTDLEYLGSASETAADRNNITSVKSIVIGQFFNFQ